MRWVGGQFKVLELPAHSAFSYMKCRITVSLPFKVRWMGVLLLAASKGSLAYALLPHVALWVPSLAVSLGRRLPLSSYTVVY